MPSNNPKAQSLIDQVVEAELNGENHTAEQLRKKYNKLRKQKKPPHGITYSSAEVWRMKERMLVLVGIYKDQVRDGRTATAELTLEDIRNLEASISGLID